MVEQFNWCKLFTRKYERINPSQVVADLLAPCNRFTFSYEEVQKVELLVGIASEFVPAYDQGTPYILLNLWCCVFLGGQGHEVLTNSIHQCLIVVSKQMISKQDTFKEGSMANFICWLSLEKVKQEADYP